MYYCYLTIVIIPIIHHVELHSSEWPTGRDNVEELSSTGIAGMDDSEHGWNTNMEQYKK
jgi:hypothetical protein